MKARAKSARWWWAGIGAAMAGLATLWVVNGLKGHDLLHAAVAGQPEPILRELETRPNNSGLWQLLGEAYAHSSRHSDAVAAYRRSLALDPSNDEAWWMLGIAQVCRGDRMGVAEVQGKLAVLHPPSSVEFARLAPLGCCAFGGCRIGG